MIIMVKNLIHCIWLVCILSSNVIAQNELKKAAKKVEQGAKKVEPEVKKAAKKVEKGTKKASNDLSKSIKKALK